MEKKMNDAMSATKVVVMSRAVPGAGIRLREASGDEAKESRSITGYAILFDTPSDPLYRDDEMEVREVIDPSAVTLDLLNASDIKFTMYHDRHILLGRSRQGSGTLSYFIDEKGVGFNLDLPSSPNGDEALEMVKRGDISGCSFQFATRYYDKDCVAREVKTTAGFKNVVYRVKSIIGIYDFTLTDNPAYSETSVEARSLDMDWLRGDEKISVSDPRWEEQVSEMRAHAKARH